MVRLCIVSGTLAVGGLVGSYSLRRRRQREGRGGAGGE
jgi:uncharacterized protein (TIGR03382 family)